MMKKYTVLILLGLLITWLVAPRVTVLPGRLSAEVGIYRDALGIARVTAYNLPDLFYAMGSALARDRLWSLYTLKRSLEGRSSAIYGTSTLPLDKFIRSLDLRQRVKGQSTDKQTTSLLLSFTRGINDYAKAVIVWPY